METLERDQFFSMLSRQGSCVGLKIFFQDNGVAGFDVLSLFFFAVISSEVTVDVSLLFTDKVLAQSLLVHFVLSGKGQRLICAHVLLFCHLFVHLYAKALQLP